MKNYWTKQHKLNQIAQQLLIQFQGKQFADSDEMWEHYEKIKKKVFVKFKDIGSDIKVKLQLSNGTVTNITIKGV